MGLLRPLLIQPSRQGGEALGFEDFPHAGRAQGTAPLLESLADFINRMVLLAHLHDQVARRRLFGLGLRTVAWGEEEGGLGFTAEMMTKDVKGIERVAKGASDFWSGAALDQIGAQGLVLAVFGQARFEEKAAECT
jgi:hypothetical protein